MSNNFDSRFDDAFDNFVKADSVENWIAMKQDAYEDKIIKFILSRFGLDKQISYYKQTLKQETNSNNLTCDWFRTKFPDFPLKLGAASTVFAHQIAVSDIFKKLTNTTFFDRYSKHIEHVLSEDGEVGTVGLVFPWPKAGNMIIHNSDSIIPANSVRLSRQVGTAKPVYLDLFNPFFDALEKQWQPTL